MSVRRFNPEEFPTAQRAREALQNAGWVPLCEMRSDGRTAENWVRHGRRCMLVYDGPCPGDVPLRAATFVIFLRVGNEIVPQHTG